ncbi:MAG: hypothetical protein NTZ33_14135 [Bacteroidetes bacterium]|nr:hypothetical protein [Bacteroidota bacterium]
MVLDIMKKLNQLIKGYLIIFVLLSFHSVYGQDEIRCNDTIFNDKFLEKLIGNWNVTGNVLDEYINYHFQARWELNHQFVELSFADTAKIPKYTAKVYIGYDCKINRYIAHWLDNFGGRYSETLGYGEKKENSIAFRFDYPDGRFINEFIYTSKTDSWLFHTTTKNDKNMWVVFGNMFLTRKN